MYLPSHSDNFGSLPVLRLCKKIIEDLLSSFYSFQEKAQTRATQVASQLRASPDCTVEVPNIITPPSSKGKGRTSTSSVPDST